MTPEDLKEKQNRALAAKLDHDAELYKTRLAALGKPARERSWLLGLIQHYAVIATFFGALITAGQFMRGCQAYKVAQEAAASAEDLRISECVATASEKGEFGRHMALAYLKFRLADTNLDSARTRLFTDLQEAMADERNRQQPPICLAKTTNNVPQAPPLSAVDEGREVPREQRPMPIPPVDPSAWQPILTNAWVKPSDMRGFRYYLQIGSTGLYFWPTVVGVDEVDFVLTETPVGRDQKVVTNSTFRVGSDFRLSYPTGTGSTNLLLKLDGIRVAGRWPTRAAFISAYIKK